MSTFLQIRTDILAQEFSPVVYTSRINNWINEAMHRICREVEVEQLAAQQTYVTVAGATDIVLPADYDRVRSLRDTDRVLELTPTELVALDNYPVSSGPPSLYAFDGTSIKLYPTPDGPYNLALRYYRDGADLVNDTDVPAIPAPYHDLLITYALSKCYRAEDDFQSAQFYMDQFKVGLAQYATDLQHPNIDYPRQLAGTWGDQHGRQGRAWF